MSAFVALLLIADPDSSATREVEREESALEEGEPGLVLEDDPRGAGRFVLAGGGYALRSAFAWRRFGLDVLLAREPGEPRAVDDAHARLQYASSSWTVALGRVQVERGAGLVLGSPRVGTGTPGMPAREAMAALSSAPARAASGFTGAWAEHRRGAWRLGVLVARTRRDARPVGDALLPLAGVRHRDARGDSARSALKEDAAALALGAGPSWLVVAHARAAPYRVPPSGATAAEQRASSIVDGSTVLEIGTRPSSGLEAALALDAHGRARTSLALERRAPHMRTVLTFESEATGFVPLRARPEHRPHAHAGALVRTGDWRFEVHAVERRAFEPARFWMTMRRNLRRGASVELRRDADPARTIVAFQVAPRRGATLATEWRFDRRGLARETWRARAFGRLPVGLAGGLELRFSGARTSVAWLDTEVPGGAWAGAGSATERARLELGRPGRVEPRVSWVRTRTASGTRSEARLAVTWSTEPSNPEIAR